MGFLMTGNRRVTEFSTKQLSRPTSSDFKRLFGTIPHRARIPCWGMHNHRSGVEKKSTPRAVLVKRKHRDKGALLEQGRSYGILVYAHGEPVGWCQYGLAKKLKELPRIDNNPKCRKLASASDGKLWRINLFCGSQEISPSWRGGFGGSYLQLSVNRWLPTFRR